jgi:hypothetical protein
MFKKLSLSQSAGINDGKSEGFRIVGHANCPTRLHCIDIGTVSFGFPKYHTAAHYRSGYSVS